MTKMLGCFLVIVGALAFAQQDVDDAAQAFKQGDNQQAERKLSAVLEASPNDVRALMLMGAVLDSESKFDAAETYYRRAIEAAPHSAQVLNNAGNHYLARGDKILARQYYLRALASDPLHVNANVQVAQIYISEKRGDQALAYLGRLPDSESSKPSVLLLRARALSLAGKCGAVNPLLNQLENGDGGSNVYFSIGIVQAQCKEYDLAESAFSRALEADPTNFEALYNLGLAALESGDLDRSVTALQAALRENPRDADSLFALARAHSKRDQLGEAATLLTQAEKAAPSRADIQLMLAKVLSQLGFYREAAETYSHYLELNPGDETARRERGMAWASANESAKALVDLEWYARKNPGDAAGLYELGMAESLTDRAKALQLLNRAVALSPSSIQIRYCRAVLNMEADKPEAALDDLRIVLEKDPSNARALSSLGRAYLALDRPQDAAAALKKSVESAPRQRAALMYYHAALEKLGRKEEADRILADLKQTDSAQMHATQLGLTEYLSLSPVERRARYLSTLQQNVEANPGDPQWRVRLAAELLSDGEPEKAEELLRSLDGPGISAEYLASAGNILVQYERYGTARPLLESAISANPSLNAARLDLAITLFHTDGAAASLAELNKMPVNARSGDYYLLLAQILDSEDKMQEAIDALNQGIKSMPTSPRLYLSAAGFLLKHRLYGQALRFLEQAESVLPGNRELLLAQAAILATIPRDEPAQAILRKLQARWPEWDRPYLLNGIILEIQMKPAEAKPMLEAAIALGADTPEAYYYEAQTDMELTPADLDGAERAIGKAMQLTSKDAYVFTLGGQIALQRKDPGTALKRLQQATALMPALIPAHYALRHAYQDLGREDSAAAELETIRHIAAENAASDKNPFPTEEFLFTVRAPG